MNNTNNYNNAILEAVGELDDSVLENAFKPRKKKPLKLIIIAAAAAAVSLFVGFTVAYKNTVVLNGEPLFDYNIKIHNEVTYPSIDELTEMGASIIGNERNIYDYRIEDIDPRDLIQKYNITLLGNENFSRADLGNYTTPSYDDAEEYRAVLSKTTVTVADNYHADGMYGSFVHFMYWLTDDRLDIPVNFRAYCMTGDYNALIAQGYTSIKSDGSDVEIIDLNNNEKALIHQTDYNDGDTTSLATFTYDGILYHIHARTDINGMKQIFSDLGITSE